LSNLQRDGLKHAAICGLDGPAGWLQVTDDSNVSDLFLFFTYKYLLKIEIVAILCFPIGSFCLFGIMWLVIIIQIKRVIILPFSSYKLKLQVNYDSRADESHPFHVKFTF
jgi:hypothetical protein